MSSTTTPSSQQRSQHILGDDIGFAYPGMKQPLFEGVHFQLHLGGTPDRIGLIGPNGHGKSTLVKLLLGELQPSTGAIHRPTQTIPIAYLPQQWHEQAQEQSISHFIEAPLAHLRAHEERMRALEREMARASASALDALIEEYGEHQTSFEASGGYQMASQLAHVMQSLELDHIEKNRPLHQCSMGQQARAALARLLLTPAQLMILDEPTNHLDIEAKQWLGEYLAASSKAMIIVSHDQALLDAMTTETWSLQDGCFERYAGTCQEYLAFRERRLEQMRHEYFVQQREIKRLEKAAKQRMEWSAKCEENKFGKGPVDRGAIGAQAARQAKRSKHIERRIHEELDKRRKALPHLDRTLDLHFEVEGHMPGTLLRLDHVTIGRGDTLLQHDLHLALHPGEHVGIMGPNGCGKSTLLEVLAGTLVPVDGARRLHPTLRIHHYTQGQTELLEQQLGGQATVLQAAHAAPNDTLARTLLAHLGFEKDQVFLTLDQLSPGQLARVALARTLRSGAHVLLLDEPTNHLDMRARQALAEGLSSFRGALVCVSHDESFLEQLGARKIRLDASRPLPPPKREGAFQPMPLYCMDECG